MSYPSFPIGNFNFILTKVALDGQLNRSTVTLLESQQLGHTDIHSLYSSLPKLHTQTLGSVHIVISSAILAWRYGRHALCLRRTTATSACAHPLFLLNSDPLLCYLLLSAPCDMACSNFCLSIGVPGCFNHSHFAPGHLPQSINLLHPTSLHPPSPPPPPPPSCSASPITTS